MAIMSGHICGKYWIKYKKNNECLLIKRCNCILVSCNLQPNDLDGCYLVYDNICKLLIRSRSAEIGIWKRWKEHQTSSILPTKSARESDLYTSYPSVNYFQLNVPSLDMRKGNFNHLAQVLGIRFERSQTSDIIHVFQWTEIEESKLMGLKSEAGRKKLVDRKCTHVVYLCKSAYALAIENIDNMLLNSSYKWQLRYFWNALCIDTGIPSPVHRMMTLTALIYTKNSFYS